GKPPRLDSVVRNTDLRRCAFLDGSSLTQKTLHALELSRCPLPVTLSLEIVHRKEDMMSDLTVEAATKQISAMATQVFEVGLFKPAITSTERHAEMVPRVWDSSTLLKAIPWLKFQNRDGRNIYVRPKGEHALSLVDDLTREALRRMKESGFTPGIVVETSPGNFQAWLNHGRVLSQRVSS